MVGEYLKATLSGGVRGAGSMPALERAVLGMSEAASVVVDMAVPRPGFFPVLMGVLQRGVYKAPTTGPSLYGTLPLYRLSTTIAKSPLASAR